MTRRALLPWALAAVVATALAVAAAYFLGSNHNPPTATVAAGPFVREVSADGELEAVSSTKLSAPMSNWSYKVAWLAADGAEVRAGDVVARFDPTEINQRVRAARSKIAELTEKIAKERASKTAKQEKLEQDAAVAQDEAEHAQTFQATDELLYSRNERLESAVDMELAESRKRHAAGLLQVEDHLAATRIELLQIDLRAEQEKLRQAEKILANLELKAPHDGIVLVERGWNGVPTRVGDRAWPGRPVVSLPDLTKMQAAVYVLEADAGGVAPGKPATVVIAAHPEKRWKATVQRIDPVAQPRVEDSPVQYFHTVLRLERTDGRVMKPGQRVHVTIEVDRLEHALWLPGQAIFTRRGRPIVYRRTGGRFQPVAVKLGPVAPGRVVVTSGLAEGDTVALVDPTRREAPTGGAGTPPPNPMGGAP